MGLHCTTHTCSDDLVNYHSRVVRCNCEVQWWYCVKVHANCAKMRAELNQEVFFQPQKHLTCDCVQSLHSSLYKNQLDQLEMNVKCTSCATWTHESTAFVTLYADNLSWHLPQRKVESCKLQSGMTLLFTKVTNTALWIGNDEVWLMNWTWSKPHISMCFVAVTD